MLKISFNFDENSKTISGLKVEQTTPKIKSINVYEDEYDLEVMENKLKLSRAALDKLNAKADDRVSINYWSEDVGKSFPVIGKAQAFTDKLDGNRVTKAGTVAFRGEKRSTLLMFGTVFTLEEFKDGIWKLVPVTPEVENLSDENEELENTDSEQIDKEVENILNEDDLPF